MLGNFDGALRWDINSVSRGGGSKLYGQEDGCKTDLKKSCESESHILRCVCVHATVCVSQLRSS